MQCSGVEWPTMASVHLCICASVPVHTGQATKQAREAFIIVGASVVMAGGSTL